MEATEHYVAADIIGRAVEEGRTGQEIQQKVADETRRLRQATTVQYAGVLDPSMGVNEAVWTQSGVELPEGVDLSSIDTEQVTAIAEKSAGDIRDILGDAKNEELPENAVGQAMQGVDGSTVVQVSSAIRPGESGGSVIDTNQLQDIYDHEKRHEQQAQVWDAESVDIGAGQELTREQVSEFDAMNVQRSTQWVSAEYKGINAFVSSVTTAEAAAEAAETGNLTELGDAIRKERGLEPAGQGAEPTLAL